MIDYLAVTDEERAATLTFFHLKKGSHDILIAGEVATPQFLKADQVWTLEKAIEACGGRLPTADERIMVIRGDEQQFNRFYRSDVWQDAFLFSRDRVIILQAESKLD